MASGASAPLAESPEKMLQGAIYRAKVMGDLPGAIQQFEAIVTKYSGKPVAGRALLEIGQAEEQLGHPDRANQAYVRILKGYPEQAKLVARLHQNRELTIDAALNSRRLTWFSPRTPVAPPARCCMGMSHDASNHTIVLFGGFTQGKYFGDTWTWHNGWHELSPPNAPTARDGPGLTYDGATGNLVLFGGVNEARESLNDTWTWDGKTWTQQFPAVSPPPRRFDGTGMVYLPTIRRVVLFGGVQGRRGLGDTWVWDGLSKTWAQKSLASSPSPRRTMMAYDATSKVIVLFGGDAGLPFMETTTYLGDTWTFDGTNWTQHNPTSAPSARGGAAMAYVASLHSVVLFGGITGRGRRTNDTWLWNGANWREVTPTDLPPSRVRAGMDYNASTDELVLFGGHGTTTLGGTWLFRVSR